MQDISLYELNSLVRKTIDLCMIDEYWVRAELSEVRESRGHCYLEFIQKDEFSHGIVAKARGQIWANKWAFLRPYFEHTTGQRLSAGMQVLVKARVTFHELYGFSLNISEIDPTFTLGDIARHRQEILRILHEEGVDTMNKELPLPRLLQRIAVISSATAAGYGDFCNQLANNDRNLVFFTELFPAVMQGNEVERSVISALNLIAERRDEWDAVVIIRGGGATSDLTGFDTLALAENVSQFPLPIITGIGHERDDTVIDIVSHTRVKTPTAAAEFLIHHQERELDLLEDFAARLSSEARNKLTYEVQHLQLLTSKVPALFSTFKAREELRITRTVMNLQGLSTQFVERERNNIAFIDNKLSTCALQLIEKNTNSISLIESKLASANPDRILRLGFSITRLKGSAVKDTSMLKEGDEIETTLLTGTIKSTISRRS
ncbi:MAG: exodeoxyribonuclease VII large subunit [Prevotellaceae bacterium]|nr:exodeoxyribonuclease VII large subunit [Candidatus Minthosoma caballi]